MEIDFELVQPLEAHGRLVMQWRNDPQTLAQSFDSRPKEWESFYPEFCSDYFVRGGMPALFAWHSGQRVAFLRFRPFSSPVAQTRRACEISINVAPEARGKGLGSAILKAVQARVADQGYDDLMAEIKADNPASHQAFTKAGFIKLKDYKKQGDTVSLYAVHLSPAAAKRPVFVIAEAGSNWRMGCAARDRAMARTLIDVAVEAGADAVKFQVYRPETVYVANAGKSEYLARAGITEDISSIFEDLAMPYEMIPELAEYCEKAGIEFMATPFSKADFDAVDPFVKRHKIASYEISHMRLIEMAASSGKPLIMSTGASVEADIAWAVDRFRQAGGKDLTLLQCTAKYPATASSMHLRVIPWLRQRFAVKAGLSDHSPDPIRAPSAAVALGASTIEKHYTLDKRLPGPDHSFALTAPELSAMIRAIRETEEMLGSGEKLVDPTEQELYDYARRGIQALRAIKRGERLLEGDNVDILRPGQQQRGVHPRYLEQLEGAQATRDIPAGAGIQEGDWS